MGKFKKGKKRMAKSILAPFDLNGDGYIDTGDLGIISNAHGSKVGDPLYDPKLDFDENGEIGDMEVKLIASLFGTKIGVERSNSESLCL